ncbi:exosome complex component CSL4 isoform X2 [Pan paniscus]|nr:exosome complex component CSL4 isoform X2 [Pan paniscus]
MEFTRKDKEYQLTRVLLRNCAWVWPMRKRLRFHPGFGTAAIMAPPVRYCIPGERLCNLEEGSPGSGTYTRHGYIFSSLAGCLMKSSENGAVSSINSRFAKVHILYVGSMPLKNSFRGTIRKEDVRATEKDKVEIYKSFRPGDIVLAKVISLGDAQSNYLLTTAENELGVVVAHSESGIQMVPISWCEMQCPKTHTKEFRKVARVQPEFLQT